MSPQTLPWGGQNGHRTGSGGDSASTLRTVRWRVAAEMWIHMLALWVTWGKLAPRGLTYVLL